MYGLILVEPEEGLPSVDREFYVMQGEIYTEAAFGQHGSQDFNVEKLLSERPEYFVFNGAVGALSKLHPLEAKVGETVRIFFGVGGPNFTSSFHVIGEMFDSYLGRRPQRAVEGHQTVTARVAPSSPSSSSMCRETTSWSTALRLERGLVGILNVEGAPNPEIYDGKTMPGGGH
jgi:nitrite reductase (NO-forming)